MEFTIRAVNESSESIYISRDALKDMNYFKYSELDSRLFGLRTVIIVKYNDLNMQALRDLSNQSNITSITVSYPYDIRDPVRYRDPIEFY